MNHIFALFVPTSTPQHIFSHFSLPISRCYTKISLLILLIGGLSIQVSAQEYSHAIGLRIGSTKGLTYKSFMGNSLAWEGMVVYHKEGFRGIALLEAHIFPGRNSNTALYAGIGAYAGVTALLDEYPGKNNVAGLTGVVGFEYVFPRSSFSFGVDINPAWELLHNRTFSGNQAALSLRYVID